MANSNDPLGYSQHHSSLLGRMGSEDSGSVQRPAAPALWYRQEWAPSALALAQVRPSLTSRTERSQVATGMKGHHWVCRGLSKHRTKCKLAGPGPPFHILGLLQAPVHCSGISTIKLLLSAHKPIETTGLLPGQSPGSHSSYLSFCPGHSLKFSFFFFFK